MCIDVIRYSAHEDGICGACNVCACDGMGCILAVAVAQDYETALRSFDEHYVRKDLDIEKCKIIELNDIPDDFVFSDYVFGGS